MRLPAVLAAIVLVAALLAADAAVAKKRHHHPQRSPLFKRLAGHSLNQTTPDSGSGSGTQRYNFCRKGGYSYRASGGSGSSYYETSFHGRWRVASSTGKTGIVQYTVTDFVSVYADGSSAGSFPGSPLAQAVNFGPFGVYFGGALFSIGRAMC
jgi:hypothetical protein